MDPAAAASYREVLTDNVLLKAENKALREENAILKARDENRGIVTQARGAALWRHLINRVKSDGGIKTFYFVDALAVLQRNPDEYIRIRKSARNPYKLVHDAVKWVFKFAKIAGVMDRLRVVKGVIGKKLKCLRFYVGIEPPQEAPGEAQEAPQGKRKCPGIVRQIQTWAARYVGFTRAIIDKDPGG